MMLIEFFQHLPTRLTYPSSWDALHNDIEPSFPRFWVTANSPRAYEIRQHLRELPRPDIAAVRTLRVCFGATEQWRRPSVASVAS